MESKAGLNAGSLVKGFALSAIAVITALGAGCDKASDYYTDAVITARAEALEVCDSLSYGGNTLDATLCSRGVIRAQRHAAATIPKESTTRIRGSHLLTGVELRSLELYRIELTPVCVAAASSPKFAGVKDAVNVCMAGALDFYSRVARNACDIDLAKISGADTQFCVLKLEMAPEPKSRPQPQPTYTNPLCHTPSRNCS